MAASHFEHLTNHDLVLLDRGYPAFWLFKLILSYNAHFCFRISNKRWKIIREFVKSGKREQVVSMNYLPLQFQVVWIIDWTQLMKLRLIRKGVR